MFKNVKLESSLIKETSDLKKQTTKKPSKAPQSFEKVSRWRDGELNNSLHGMLRRIRESNN